MIILTEVKLVENPETGVSFIGCKVDVVYDRADISQLTIEYEVYPFWTAKRLVFGEKSGSRPKLSDYGVATQDISSITIPNVAEIKKLHRVAVLSL